MNEQLVVKNFGPIKDATVDFKRVTVFIGPTGGGKSTLAKLAAVFRTRVLFTTKTAKEQQGILNESLFNYEINNYARKGSAFRWRVEEGKLFDELNANEDAISVEINLVPQLGSKEEYVTQKLQQLIENSRNDKGHELEAAEVYYFTQSFTSEFDNATLEWYNNRFPQILYIPSDRLYASAASRGMSIHGLQNVSLGKPILNFLEDFGTSKRSVAKFSIKFLGVVSESNGIDSKINTPDSSLYLHESASGIQSVAPMLSVIIDKLHRNSISFRPETFSFIIEEPELNLYPTAQQGLLNWLVEKCTKGENDLTITTHSPYLLAHFNLLLYAYQVAENHPERADDVSKIVPRESWINPKEFAAYHVEGQLENGVRSIVNSETGLISYNGLDATANAETSEFEKLLDINAGLEVE
jgi:predicted ATPase